MRLSRMYKIEKNIHYCRERGLIDSSRLNTLHLVFKNGNYYVTYENTSYLVSDLEEAFYIEAAIMIPYPDMLELLNYCKENLMEETVEMRFWDGVIEQYGVDVETIKRRIYSVTKLSNSLIYKRKIEKLFGLEENKKHRY